MELSLEELKKYAKEFVQNLPANSNERAHLVGLKGELGAGKTTFVQLVAEVLGVKENVTSPTFVIAQNYKTDHPVFKKLIHIDAYRLSEENKDTVGFSFYQSDPNALVLVEWPEYIPNGFPEDASILLFETIDEKTRKVTHA